MILITKFVRVVSRNPIDIITIIPIVISIISLTVSLLIAIRAWWIERFKLDFEMIKWFCIPHGKTMFLWLYITNYSKLPCSVLEIKIYNERNGNIAEGSGTGNKKLISTSKITDREDKENYSLSYPVTIEPYNSIGGYFHVISKFGLGAYEEDTIKITVRTSRGTITKRVFMDYGKNIYRVIEHKKSPNDEKMVRRSDGSTINYIDDMELN